MAQVLKLLNDAIPATTTTLNFYGKEVADAELKELASLTQLTSLFLGGGQVTDEGLKELSCLKQLAELDLYGTKVTDEGLDELAGLTQLKSLTLNATQVTDAGLKKLSCLQRLTELDVGDTGVTDKGLKELSSLKQLTMLVLGGTHVTDAGLKELSCLNQLTKLDLSGTQVTDAGLKELSNLTRLTLLFLNNTRVTDAGLKELASLHQLGTLFLFGTQVTDEGLKELARVKQLTKLFLARTKITHAGLKHLAGLKQLASLHLGGMQVTNVGLKELAKLTQLTELDLGRTNVTDAGLKELSSLIQLTQLDLSDTQVTDAGIVELANLKRLSSLNLDGTEVTDAGLKELASLSYLTELKLDGTAVTDAGRQKLANLKQLAALNSQKKQLAGDGTKELKEDFMSDIFMSYVEEDTSLVLQMVQGLEEAGYSTWYYRRDSLPGVSYLQSTGQAIEQARAFLLVITPQSVLSNQVTAEVVRAHECKKPFIPVLSGLSHAEFQKRQPEWRQCAGAAASVSVPPEGVGVVLPRVIAGLKALGIHPERHSAKQCPACGADILFGALSCMDCGFLLAAAEESTGQALTELCPNPTCGVANSAGERHCARCGTALRSGLPTFYNRFKVEKVLEKRDASCDYLARDLKTDRLVKVKEMIGQSEADFNLRRQFLEREAELLRLIGKHPLVPRVLDVLYKDLTAHLIVELPQGRTLLDVLEESGPFPFDQVVEWGIGLCDVLYRMHTMKPPRLFLAMKPSNIGLLEDGQGIKLLDFSESAGSLRSAVKDRVFTDNYAPMEKIVGKPEVRSDFFYLAATLYQLLTGKEPEGHYTQSIIQQQLTSPSAPIPKNQLWFYELIKTNFAEDPQDRYYSARMIKGDLERRRIATGVRCPKCQEVNKVREPYCTKCKQPLTPALPPCECGKINRMGNRTCLKCGKTLR